MPTNQDVDSRFPTPPSPPTPGLNSKSSIAIPGQGESRAMFPRGLEATNEKTFQANFVSNLIIEQQEVAPPCYVFLSPLFPFSALIFFTSFSYFNFRATL